MAEARKELLKSIMAAMALACLLAAGIHYFFEPRGSQMRVPLALGEASQFSESCCSILNGDWLILEVVFSNGSTITMSPFSGDASQGVPAFQDYAGEFNATGLNSVILSTTSVKSKLSDPHTIIRTLVAYQQDRTIDTVLIDENRETTDLGSSRVFGVVKTIQAGRFDFDQRYYQAILDGLQASLNVTKQLTSSRGCWRIADYVWHVNVGKLSSVLQGSGIATITFSLDVIMDLRYGLFRTAGENVTGGVNLKWNGTWGTLDVTHEDGKITWVKYRFSLVALVMQ